MFPLNLLASLLDEGALYIHYVGEMAGHLVLGLSSNPQYVEAECFYTNVLNQDVSKDELDHIAELIFAEEQQELRDNHLRYYN